MKRYKKNKDFKKDYKQPIDLKEAVQLKPLEVTLKECNGDNNKMIKKFLKKVRKYEILKPYYDRIMFHQTKNQVKRKKQRKSKYQTKKNQKKKEKEFEKEEGTLYEQLMKK